MFEQSMSDRQDSEGTGASKMRYVYAPGDRPLEGFRVDRAIGRGGFGEVYEGTSDAGKRVALKLIQHSLEIELRGVRHCLNIKHPNLVTVFDVQANAHGEHWIVMELMAGRSLAEAIAAHPAGMTTEEALRWLRGICDGVDALHQQGIVHRDLKPANIFEDGGVIKVGDYGLAKFITASRRSGQTQSVGTVHYMAPEVGSGRYGREVDLYAVGVMFYEMLTGDVPFNGECAAEILMKHMTAPPDLARVPPEFRGVIGRMLAKRPEDRYGSPRAVLADLEARIADSKAGIPTGEMALTAPYESAAAALPPFEPTWRPTEHRPPAWLGATVRDHPILTAVAVWFPCVLLTVIYGLSRSLDPQAPPMAFNHALGYGLPISGIVAAMICSWAFLWRAVAPTPTMLAARHERARSRAGRSRGGALSHSLRQRPLAWTTCMFLTTVPLCFLLGEIIWPRSHDNWLQLTYWSLFGFAILYAWLRLWSAHSEPDAIQAPAIGHRLAHPPFRPSRRGVAKALVMSAIVVAVILLTISWVHDVRVGNQSATIDEHRGVVGHPVSVDRTNAFLAIEQRGATSGAGDAKVVIETPGIAVAPPPPVQPLPDAPPPALTQEEALALEKERLRRMAAETIEHELRSRREHAGEIAAAEPAVAWVIFPFIVAAGALLLLGALLAVVSAVRRHRSA